MLTLTYSSEAAASWVCSLDSGIHRRQISDIFHPSVFGGKGSPATVKVWTDSWASPNLLYKLVITRKWNIHQFIQTLNHTWNKTRFYTFIPTMTSQINLGKCKILLPTSKEVLVQHQCYSKIEHFKTCW